MKIRYYIAVAAQIKSRQRGKGLAVGNNTRIITEDEVELLEKRAKEKERKEMLNKTNAVHFFLRTKRTHFFFFRSLFSLNDSNFVSSIEKEREQ